MLLLGIDLGTSSIKVSVVDATTQKCLASAYYPETEMDIIAIRQGWAEQSADLWWEHVKQAILKCHATSKYDPRDIGAIGIAYQMHGLVMVDRDQKVLHNAIIWCDGRAVETGDAAFAAIGEQKCLSHLLNSPGNFTAAKLGWVMEHHPEVFERISKVMLPGDFISMKFTGEITTTSSALSEGIFWDFMENEISSDVLDHFGFSKNIFPEIKPVFAHHGYLKEAVAARLSLKTGIPVSYKAGDQLNNAFSLNAMQPGEVAATAGTSGVIYGISDQLTYDPQSRINSFAHVNHEPLRQRVGVLLCINGAGISNRWVRNMMGASQSYDGLNTEAARIKPGAEGLMILPFGNGAERMLGNKMVGAHIQGLDFNLHQAGHVVRAVQEGVAFAFRYGLDIMRENGMDPNIIRAGKTNMFLSEVFVQAFVNATGVPVELYQTDGSIGAALGAGTGMTEGEAGNHSLKRSPITTIEPDAQDQYHELYVQWRSLLDTQLQSTYEVSQIS